LDEAAGAEADLAAEDSAAVAAGSVVEAEARSVAAAPAAAGDSLSL